MPLLEREPGDPPAEGRGPLVRETAEPCLAEEIGGEPMGAGVEAELDRLVDGAVGGEFGDEAGEERDAGARPPRGDLPDGQAPAVVHLCPPVLEIGRPGWDAGRWQGGMHRRIALVGVADEGYEAERLATLGWAAVEQPRDELHKKLVGRLGELGDAIELAAGEGAGGFHDPGDEGRAGTGEAHHAVVRRRCHGVAPALEAGGVAGGARLGSKELATGIVQPDHERRGAGPGGLGEGRDDDAALLGCDGLDDRMGRRCP